MSLRRRYHSKTQQHRGVGCTAHDWHTGGVTDSASPYAATTVAFATMHGKELLARAAFRDTLGADVIAVDELDTDQFGTFSGDIERTLTPLAAAREKTRLGMHLAGTPFALASEGSFSSPMGLLVEHHEVLMFVDATRGFELTETLVTTSPVPAATTVTTVDAALRWAAAAAFPVQGVVIRADAIVKDLASVPELTACVGELLDAGQQVLMQPDYRAHRCPSRSAVITTLAERMALRLATLCARCQCPGFGQVGVERGLPCEYCGEPTHLVAAQIMGCAQCEFTQRVPRAEQFALAQWCDGCNP